MDLFERLAKGRPPPQKFSPPLEFAPTQKLPPAQKLLNWLLHDWDKPTVSLQDICYLGPNSIRKRENALPLAETLVGLGWLTPIPTHRRDRKEWQILKENDP
jgi:hypothetical protein